MTLTLSWILLFVITFTWLAYHRASLSVWSLGIFAYLLLLTKFSSVSAPSLTLLWIIFAATALILNVRPLRRALLTNTIFHIYQKSKPSISATEKEALTIGSVGWEGELLSGKPNWQLWQNYAAPKLTDEEQHFLDNDVEQLCQMLNNWDICHNLHDLPADVWQFLKQHGFFGMIIPKQYGGKQFSALAHSAVIAKIASCSSSAATIVGVPNSLGPAELLLEYGTDQQKNYYLPRLASGEEIPCFALTGPDAGSDASAMTDRGIVCKDQFEGKETVGIRLRWNKRYITLAPVATLLGLAFKLFDPDHLIGEREDIGITCVLIPKHLPGVIKGRRHFPLNSAFPNGPTQGEDVFIPIDWIIGGTAMAGKGWHMLMERLSVGRAITLPSLSTGGAKMAAFTTGAYARIRRQFHVAVGRFEGVEEALTRIAGYTYIMDATRLFGVAAVDRGEQPTIPSAISKYHTTELARQVVNDAMDVHGGKGICMGPRNYIAQMYEEAPIAITVEGANILTRCMIIFGQGLMRCHPYLLKELTAAQNPDSKQALIDFDKVFFSHLGFTISNKARAVVLGLTQGRIARTPGHAKLKRYYQQFTRFSAALAYVADIAAFTLGGELKRREHLSGRLADVLSMLYIGSAVLKQFENHGSPAEDLPLVEWSCQTLLFKLQTAFDAALRNFPKAGAGCLLRPVVFPLGLRLRAPSDKLGHQVSVLLSSDNPTRSRLTAGIYSTAHPNNAVGLVGLALEEVLVAEIIEKKISDAAHAGHITAKAWPEKLTQALVANIISEEEKQLLLKAEASRQQVGAVDDFAPEEL
jgi:acyl-CoA dehydrogenase